MQQPDHIFDSLLITEYQSGNKQALSLLVKRWHPTFCRQAQWYVNDSVVAQDVAQECWIVIIKKMGSLKDARKFAAWALTIVHRKAIDHHRAKQKAGIYSQEGSLDNIPEAKKINDNEAVLNNERLAKVNSGIEKLPLKQRIVIELYYKNELTLDQIADVLDVNKGTVKSRLFYARETLKKLLKT